MPGVLGIWVLRFYRYTILLGLLPKDFCRSRNNFGTWWDICRIQFILAIKFFKCLYFPKQSLFDLWAYPAKYIINEIFNKLNIYRYINICFAVLSTILKFGKSPKHNFGKSPRRKVSSAKVSLNPKYFVNFGKCPCHHLN